MDLFGGRFADARDSRMERYEIGARLCSFLNSSSAWSTRDGKTREAILEKRLAPDVQYVDPNAETLGYARISAYMADFQRELPGRRFVISDVIAHHDRCLAHWTMQNEESKVEMEGASFAEISPDGRLRRIYGFFRSTSSR